MLVGMLMGDHGLQAGDHEELIHHLLGYRAAPFPMTELAWLRGCQSIWDQILQSTDLREYVDLAGSS